MSSTFTALARTTLLVHDPDDALAFYRDVLGFEVLFDADDPRGRLLHVGLPAQSQAGLWIRAAATDEERALVGRQAGNGPLFVLYTDDAAAACAALEARGVTFRRGLYEEGGSRIAHVEDPFGNELVVAERPCVAG